MKIEEFKRWLVASGALILVAGCAVTSPVGSGGEVEVAEPPPTLIMEKVPPSPGPGYVWIGGAWDWHGHWMWDRGHWDRPPHPGAVWVPHRYVERDGKHVFIHGEWK
jgi:hypothetical protein